MLSKNAITVLEKRYLLKDQQGKLSETPEGLFERVARALAESDRKYGATDAQVEQTTRQFYDLTYNLDFLPNSPTLANAGTRTGQLSACFVLPVPDDLAGIFESIKNAALIHQTGGGTGFAFSRLRPKNDLVQSTKGVSSGPVSFMDVFNAATESIKQGGMRRGDRPGHVQEVGHRCGEVRLGGVLGQRHQRQGRDQPGRPGDGDPDVDLGQAPLAGALLEDRAQARHGDVEHHRQHPRDVGGDDPRVLGEHRPQRGVVARLLGDVDDHGDVLVPR